MGFTDFDRAGPMGERLPPRGGLGVGPWKGHLDFPVKAKDIAGNFPGSSQNLITSHLPSTDKVLNNLHGLQEFANLVSKASCL